LIRAKFHCPQRGWAVHGRGRICAEVAVLFRFLYAILCGK
jgi:hypothetical protein